MGIEQYLGLGKPDDKKKIPASLLSIITETFREWSAFVETHMTEDPVYVPAFRRNLDQYKREAIRILAPHDKKLPEELCGEAIFIPIRLLLQPEYHRFAGIFYSAMLDLGKRRTLIIPNTSRGITDRSEYKYSFWGYKIKKGTIINKRPGEWIGEYAQGGLFLNEAKNVIFGCAAKAGLFVNYGSAKCTAQHARGGIFITHGHAGSYLYAGESPLVLNYGTADRIYLFHKKKCEVRDIKKPFLLYGSIMIYEPEIKKDAFLFSLWDDISTHSQQRAFSKVSTLAARLKHHCARHYQQNI